MKANEERADYNALREELGALQAELMQREDTLGRFVRSNRELAEALQAAANQLECSYADFAGLVEIAEACFSTNVIRSRQGSQLAKLAAVNSERALQNARAALKKTGCL